MAGALTLAMIFWLRRAMEEKVYKEAFSISYDDKEGDLSRHVMDIDPRPGDSRRA